MATLGSVLLFFVGSVLVVATLISAIRTVVLGLGPIEYPPGAS